MDHPKCWAGYATVFWLNKIRYNQQISTRAPEAREGPMLVFVTPGKIYLRAPAGVNNLLLSIKMYAAAHMQGRNEGGQGGRNSPGA